MREEDLPLARQIYRDSFSAFLRAPDSVLGDADLVGARFLSCPETSYAAELNGTLVGVDFALIRGTMATIGPVIVKPKGWTGNAGTLLTEKVLAVSAERGARYLYGYTFATSPRHLEFFRKFDVWPRFLTATMSLPITRGRAGEATAQVQAFSTLDAAERERGLADLRALCDTAFEGLDWGGAVREVAAHTLGETLLVRDGSQLLGAAVCHVGPRSEAGSDAVYVKYGIARPAPDPKRAFAALLDAVIAFARAQGVRRVNAGISTARTHAYAQMADAGFVITEVGVAMVRPNTEGHMRPDVYLLDDGR